VTVTIVSRRDVSDESTRSANVSEHPLIFERNNVQSILCRAAVAILFLIAVPAFAQYPAKPIHIIVPSAPGDGSDLTRG
jgi:hypothetical protein